MWFPRSVSHCKSPSARLPGNTTQPPRGGCGFANGRAAVLHSGISSLVMEDPGIVSETSPATALPAWLYKRDGRLVPFEPDKISQSLFGATESLGRPDAFL